LFAQEGRKRTRYTAKLDPDGETRRFAGEPATEKVSSPCGVMESFTSRGFGVAAT
jgi:hypothetical protein